MGTRRREFTVKGKDRSFSFLKPESEKTILKKGFYITSQSSLLLGFHNRATEILESLEDDEDSPSLESSASLAFGPRTESEEGSGEVDTSFI